MISYIIIATIAVMLSCGNMRDADRVPEAFAGDWSGIVHIEIPPEIVRDYATTLPVAVNGREATISGLCPDGTESIVLGGFDGTIAWQGSVQCKPSWVLGCAVALEYTSATARVSDVGQLEVSAAGKAHRSPLTDLDCSGFVQFTMQFTGDQSQ